jgi:hypothetical protein
MVRAILDGRKTATRRVMKPQPILKNRFWKFRGVGWGDNKKSFHPVPCHSLYNRMPYKPGDIIYVRETWFWEPCWDCGYDTEEGHQCPEDAVRRYDANRKEHGCYYYKASMEENAFPSVDTYHPSIHMKKEAARIWLKVTDVRVERLQDITEKQAKAEGANYKDGRNVGMEEKMCRTAIERFAEIWDSTVNKSYFKQYGWKANPWVWVIEFERCEKPKEKEVE